MTLTGPFLDRGRSQSVDEAGNEAVHLAHQVQAAHLARILLPPAAPPHPPGRPHLRLRPQNLTRTSERQRQQISHHQTRLPVHQLPCLSPQGARVRSLKLPIGAQTVDPSLRLLRERNLPPKVVDPLSFDQGEVQLAIHARLRQDPVRNSSLQVLETRDALQGNGRAAEVVFPVDVVPHLPPVEESSRRIINLRKRKGNEERENHQRLEKQRKISLPRFQLPQSRVQSLKRELRPRH